MAVDAQAPLRWHAPLEFVKGQESLDRVIEVLTQIDHGYAG